MKIGWEERNTVMNKAKQQRAGYQRNVMLSTTNSIKLIKVHACNSECFQAEYYCNSPPACFVEEP